VALPHGKTQLERIGPTSTSIAGRFDPVAVAAFAIAVSAAGSARPSFWFDEAATISAGSRSLPELWRLLGNIDAVHGLYYLLMHAWLTIFPATEFWLRLPSCLAVGVAAAGVVVLGKSFSSRTVAVALRDQRAHRHRCVSLGLESVAAHAGTPAFPGVEGAGTNATGGRGGAIVRLTAKGRLTFAAEPPRTSAKR